MSVEKEPHVVATCKDGTWWLLAADTWESVTDAMTHKAKVWRGRNAYGERCSIRVSDLTGCVEKTAASLAIIAHEAQERRTNELLGTS